MRLSALVISRTTTISSVSTETFSPRCRITEISRSYKFFIAAYSFIEPDLNNDEDYVMWQYSATGSVRGIRGNVDMSRFVGRHSIKDILY